MVIIYLSELTCYLKSVVFIQTRNRALDLITTTRDIDLDHLQVLVAYIMTPLVVQA